MKNEKRMPFFLYLKLKIRNLNSTILNDITISYIYFKFVSQLKLQTFLILIKLKNRIFTNMAKSA